MGLTYGREKLYAALYCCVASKDSLQDRLLNAWSSGLYRLTDKDLPPESWKDLTEMKKAMGWDHAKNDEGDWKASTDNMPDDEARQWIEKILGIFYHIAELGPS
jgi:hypothetical protein